MRSGERHVLYFSNIVMYFGKDIHSWMTVLWTAWQNIVVLYKYLFWATRFTDKNSKPMNIKKTCTRITYGTCVFKCRTTSKTDKGPAICFNIWTEQNEVYFIVDRRIFILYDISSWKEISETSQQTRKHYIGIMKPDDRNRWCSNVSFCTICLSIFLSFS